MSGNEEEACAFFEKSSQKKVCLKCHMDTPNLFGKAYYFTSLCKVCNEDELEKQREVAKRNKEDFNAALRLLEVFKVDIPRDNFHVVVTIPGLLLFEAQLPHCLLAGLDTETRPMFKKGVSDKNPTALLQIALRCHSNNVTTDMVFILDLFTLTQQSSTRAHLSRVLLAFFENENIIKLGQGLDIDLKELMEAYPGDFFGGGPSPSPSCCILSSVLEVSDLHDLFTEGKINKVKTSLQRMTFDHLHKNLLKSKKLTLSNWERRPLSHDQVNYAACDALVLLRLFDRLTTTSPTGGGISSETMKSLVKSFTFKNNTDDGCTVVLSNLVDCSIPVFHSSPSSGSGCDRAGSEEHGKSLAGGGLSSGGTKLEANRAGEGVQQDSTKNTNHLKKLFRGPDHRPPRSGRRGGGKGGRGSGSRRQSAPGGGAGGSSSTAGSTRNTKRDPQGSSNTTSGKCGKGGSKMPKCVGNDSA